MSHARAVTVLVALCLPLALGEACKHLTEEETRAGSAKPLSTEPPFPSESPTDLDDLDASVDASSDASSSPSDASPDAKPAAHASAGALAQCCSGLRQSVGTAPPQIQGAYLMAAGACDAMAKNGALQIAKLRGMVLGASLPASCK